MPSTYVPARAVAQPVARPRARVSQRVRELAMLLALAAPAALAQQAAPPGYDASMSTVNGGVGEAKANNYVVVGAVGTAGGTASAGSFSLTSGGFPSDPASNGPSDMIFGNNFD